MEGKEIQEMPAQEKRSIIHLDLDAFFASVEVLKIPRYADFTTLTRQMALMVPTDDERALYRVALALLHGSWQRDRPIRLLCVAGRQLSPPSKQLSVW